MRIEKRRYEERAVRDLRADLAKHGRVVAVAPTGAGKTVIAALMIAREKRWRRVLWVAHRYELVDQAYATLTALGLDTSIAMAQEERLHGADRRRYGARVLVASVQTVDRRGVPEGIDLIVFDEAHRVMADSYQRVADACPRAEVLGLTATPARMDGRGLGDFFRFMRIVAQPSDLYADGYLANPRVFSALPDVVEAIEQSLKGARTAYGDYTVESLCRVVDNGMLIGKVVSESQRIAPGVPKAVFACSVEHSQRICEDFKRAGVAAAHLDGKTPAEERERVLSDLRAGVLEVVCNVDVLSEGWDLPALGGVVIARPTKSLARFLQMAGRVQRRYGTARPVVLDHGANVQRFGVLPGQDIPWALATGDGTEADDPKAKVCPSCGAGMAWGERTCEECGAEQEVRATPRREREEQDARLVEITRAQLDTLRARIEAMAKRKGAPEGWAERVYREVAG